MLDAGPAAFLHQIEVAPKLDHDRFVGWQLVQLVDHASPVGSLRTANQLTAQLWRGDAQLTLAFTIEP